MIARFSDNITSGSNAGDYVIIWGGGNDIVAGDNATTTEASLQSMYNTSHTAVLKVIAVTITPFKNYVATTSTHWNYADTVNTWIKAKPSNVDYVIDEHLLVENITDIQALSSLYDSGDHAHMNDAGYAVVANAIYNTIFAMPTSPLSNTGYINYLKVTNLNVVNLGKK